MPVSNYNYNCFALDSDNEEYISNIIYNIILNEVNIIIDNKYISTLDIPLTTELTMYKLYSIINLSMYPHDGILNNNNEENNENNEKNNEKKEVLEHFQYDNEPIPSLIDNWARGAGK